MRPGVFRGAPDDLVVTLELAPAAAWVAESVPSETVEEHEDGSRTMVLRVADPSWLQRLVWREGGSLRVVDPPEMVRAVREGAARALSAVHGAGAGPGHR